MSTCIIEQKPPLWDNIQDVQEADLVCGGGGMNVTNTIEGAERYRLTCVIAEYRDSPEQLSPFADC